MASVLRKWKFWRQTFIEVKVFEDRKEREDTAYKLTTPQTSYKSAAILIL